MLRLALEEASPGKQRLPKPSRVKQDRISPFKERQLRVSKERVKQSGPEAEKHVMLRKESRLKLVGILLLIVVGIVGVGAYLLNGRLSNKPQQEYETAAALKRDVGAVVQATGIVKAMVGADVKVGARMPGKVVELPINVGDRVNKGQVIAKIEQDDLVAKVKLQKAVLAEAKAEEMRLAKDFERDQTTTVPLARSPPRSWTRVKHNTKWPRQGPSNFRPNSITGNLSSRTPPLSRPIKGTVASVNTMQGETVVTGLNAPTFIRIIDLDRLEVLAYVDENDIGKVQVDQEAIFTVAAHQATEFQGKVTSIYPSATTQDNVVYYITSISVDNRGGKLRPDMTANVSIFIDRRNGVVTVPHKAVKREGTRKFVLVTHKGLLEKRFVKVGLRDQTYLEILDGLKRGRTRRYRRSAPQVNNGRAFDVTRARPFPNFSKREPGGANLAWRLSEYP